MITIKKTIAIVLVLGLFACFFSCNFTIEKDAFSVSTEDYEAYLGEVLKANQYMPALDLLGGYETFFIGRKTARPLADDYIDSLTLLLEYDEIEYEQMKSYILGTYDFFAETESSLQDVFASVEGYNIYLVHHEDMYADVIVFNPPTGESRVDGKAFYCHEILLIGFDDINHKIAFLYHYNHDNGSIQDLDQLIQKEYCF